MPGGRTGLVVVAVVAVALAACSGGGSDDTSASSRTTMTTAPSRTATVVGETVVSSAYRQGVAKTADGWIFSLNNALFRTDDALTEQATLTNAIPAAYARRGFNHIGDIDVVGDVIFAPFEQPDYQRGVQVTARYDARTLAFIDARDVPQHQNSFVTVDPRTGIAYSMDEFGGKALVRYDTRHGWKRLPPLRMSQFVDKVQGGDAVGDAVWLSTDDKIDGVYRVDLHTGAVQSLGSIGHVDGEGEGIDATPLPRGDLHVLSADVALVPMRLIDLRVQPSR
jgi:hypothetical protein